MIRRSRAVTGKHLAYVGESDLHGRELLNDAFAPSCYAHLQQTFSSSETSVHFIDELRLRLTKLSDGLE